VNLNYTNNYQPEGDKMPRIGKIILEIFGEENLKHAQKKENIFEAWGDIVREAFNEEHDNNNIQVAKLIENSKPTTISNNVIIVVTGHTGWLQILQTKKKELLKIIQSRFNTIPITEIEFILGAQKFETGIFN
jgi:predicted nucleic acid-binding Zn ribbon protein